MMESFNAGKINELISNQKVRNVYLGEKFLKTFLNLDKNNLHITNVFFLFIFIKVTSE